MVKLIKYIMLFVCANMFAQKTYTFDYYAVYEFKHLESDSISIFEYNLGSTLNKNISLQFWVKNNELTTEVQLVDFENLFVYTYDIPQKKIIDIPNLNTWFKSYEKNNLNLKNCRKKRNYTYKIIKGEAAGEYAFIIERYNRKGTKLIEKSYYKSEKSDIIKNQIFSSFLKNSIFCNKFEIEFKDIITESFFVKADSIEKNAIRKLIQLEKISLTINTVN